MPFEINPNIEDMSTSDIQKTIRELIKYINGEGKDDPEKEALNAHLVKLAERLQELRKKSQQDSLNNGETVSLDEDGEAPNLDRPTGPLEMMLKNMAKDFGGWYEVPEGVDLMDRTQYEEQISFLDAQRIAKEELERIAANSSSGDLAGMDVTDRIITALEIIIDSGELGSEVTDNLRAFLEPENLALFVTILTVFMAAGSNPVVGLLGGGMFLLYAGDMGLKLGSALYHLATADTDEEYENAVLELFQFMGKFFSDLIVMVATMGFMKSRPGRVTRVRVRRGFGRMRRNLKSRWRDRKVPPAGRRPPPASSTPHRAAYLEPLPNHPPARTAPPSAPAAKPAQTPRGGYAEPPNPANLTKPPPHPEPFRPPPRHGYAEPPNPANLTKPPPHLKLRIRNRGKPNQSITDETWLQWRLRNIGFAKRVSNIFENTYQELFGRTWPRSRTRNERFERRHVVSKRLAKSTYKELTDDQLRAIIRHRHNKFENMTEHPTMQHRNAWWRNRNPDKMTRDQLIGEAVELHYNDPTNMWIGHGLWNGILGNKISGGRNIWSDLDLPPNWRAGMRDYLRNSSNPRWRGERGYYWEKKVRSMTRKLRGGS